MKQHLTQITRRRLHHAWARLTQRGRPRVTITRVGASPRSVRTVDPQFRLAHVADPQGSGSILAVQGLLNAAAIEALHHATSPMPSGSRLYLDLTGASILAGPWLRMLEALVDALEARDVSVSVVGISPHHPELRRH